MYLAKTDVGDTSIASSKSDVIASDSMCKTCFRLDPESIKNSIIGTSWKDLQSSAGEGCSSCNFLIEGISGQVKRWLESAGQHLKELSPLGKVQLMIYSDSELKAWTNVGPNGAELKDQTHLGVEFYTLAGAKSPWRGIGMSSNIPTTLTLDHCIDLAKKWLKKCSEEHPGCFDSSRLGLPTRLLDVSLYKSGFVRLLETRRLDCTNPTKYMTLSHCWGQAQAMVTTTSTLEEHYTGIKFTTLPKSFQDAVSITFHLGIQYIWIDSLCIIQDEPLDWQAEAGRMASVYSASYLTLAALHSKDNHGGCFSDRYTRSCSMGGGSGVDTPTGSTAINWRLGDDEYSIMGRLQPHNAHYIFRGLKKDDTPLGTRAWAFQERLLSPRTLFFHHEELVWECNNALWCECQFLDSCSNDEKRTLQHPRSYLKNKVQSNPETGLQEIANNWLDVVSAYTTLHRTKESDLLPALLGLASHFSTRMKRGYLAGHWAIDLTRSLIWRRQRTPSMAIHSGSSDPLNDNPSWSWTAVGGNGVQITYFEAQNRDFKAHSNFRVLACPALDSGVNPYDGCVKGYLKIQGPAVLATFKEGLEEGKKDSSQFVFLNSLQSLFWPDLDLKSPGLCQTLDGDQVLCLQVGRLQKGSAGQREHGEKPGLYCDPTDVALVLKACGKEENVYRRIGLIKVLPEDKWFIENEVETVELT